MGQEYFINDRTLENKVRELLPSQGGAGAGFDLSASTQIIPIVDLTESAEGSNLRQDLQKALSLTSITSFEVFDTTTTIVNNTGYFRVFGNFNCTASSGSARDAQFSLTDGSTTKIITKYTLSAASGANNLVTNFDFVVFISAGDSLTATTNDARSILSGSTRQIADIDGGLVNPL
jgi:hypothetical protein